MQGLQDVMVALEQLWNLFKAVVPGLISAAIILLVGYVIGRLVGTLISSFLRRFLGLDRWVRKKGLADELYGIRPSSLFAGLVKWYIYLIFIGVAAENIGSGVLADVAKALVEYSPKILAGFLLMFIGLVVGSMMKKQILGSTLAGKEFFGSLLKFSAIAIFTIVALSTMGVDVSLLIQTVIIAVAAIAISVGVAVGIALGLVLKDELRPYVRSALREMLRKQSVDNNGEVEEGLYPP